MSVVTQVGGVAALMCTVVALSGCEGVTGQPEPLRPAGPVTASTAAEPEHRTSQISLDFASKTVRKHKLTTISVSLDTAGEPVNVAQIYLNLPKGRLSCSADPTSATSTFSVSATKCTGSSAAIALSTTAGQLYSSSGAVAVVYLKAGRKAGKATVSVRPAQTLVLSSQTSHNLLNDVPAASVRVR